jgi:hypothetical protein
MHTATALRLGLLLRCCACHHTAAALVKQQQGDKAVQQQPAAATATTAAKPYMASLDRHTARDTWPARIREQPRSHNSPARAASPLRSSPAHSCGQPATCQIQTCQPPSAALRTAQQEQQQPKKTESSQPLAGPPTLPRKQRRRASQPHTTPPPACTRRAQACCTAQPALPSSYPDNSQPIKEEPTSQHLRHQPPRNQRHITRPAYP